MRKYPGQSEQIKDFIEAVCSQVKSKWAHNLLKYELTAHIEDQKSAYMQAGADELTAEARAIEQMGDPVEVGGYFNQVHRRRPEFIPNVIMWALAGIIALACISFSVILFIIIFFAGQPVIALIMGASSIIFSLIAAFTFVTVWKVTADWIFGYMLVRDYRHRREEMINRRKEL